METTRQLHLEWTMINYYFTILSLYDCNRYGFKLRDSCYNTLCTLKNPKEKRDRLKYSIIIYSIIPLPLLFLQQQFFQEYSRGIFSRREKKLIGESLLREEMLIRTIDKRKFHEESFSFDFFFFFLPTNRVIQSTPCSKLRPVSTEAIIKNNQFLLVSFHWNPNEGWMESWKPIKHRTMSRVGCRRITPSDYPLKRKRKLEIATVGTVDIFVPFRL